MKKLILILMAPPDPQIDSPCPTGINTTAINHSYVRVTGGVGTAESVQLTNVVPSGSNCSITITTTSHTGSWQITNNGDGLQEALVVAADSNYTKAVQLDNGYFCCYRVWQPIWVPAKVSIFGAGPAVSIIQAQTTTNGILDAASAGSNTFRDFRLSILGASQGTTTSSYGIRFGDVSNDNTLSTIDNVTFDNVAWGVLSINVSLLKITNSTFDNSSSFSILIDNSIHPDYAGLQLTNNIFNFSASGASTGFVYIHATSSQEISNNTFVGNGKAQYCIYTDSTTSGGWANITGNKCEAATMAGFKFIGEWTQLSFVGNTLGNTGTPVTGWKGIFINGTTNMYRNVIASNIIQCGSTTNNGVDLQGTYSTTTVSGNEIMGCDIGISAAGSPSTTLLSENHITSSITSDTYIAGTGVVIHGGSFTYALLSSSVSGIANAGNGSWVFCSDCNSTCTAGSSNGRNCYKENSSWTH